MNVLQYFQQHFPRHAYRTARDKADLESMPLDSNCGDDCKKAIDRAAEFLKSVAEAYGDEPGDHPKGHNIRQEVGAATVEVCACFICG